MKKGGLAMVTKKGNKVNKLASLFISLMLFGISLPSSAWADYTYTEIIPPAWQSAQAYAINDGGAIVGGGGDANDIGKGFLYSGGNYTEIIPPAWQSAEAWAINHDGAIVGEGYDANYVIKGFLYSGGNYTEIIPPAWKRAAAWAINDGGAIVGGGYDVNDIEKGFIATFQSTCAVWSGVIAKYQAYVNGQVTWVDVITCYTQYITEIRY
jgi:hypothetical protein